MKPRRTKKTDQRGSVFIEFALSFLVLFSIFTGAFEFGYAFYSYNTLVNAVREGARYASLKPYDSASSTPSTDFNTAVQNMVVYANPSPSNHATPILHGLSTSNVNLTVLTSGSAPVQMTVSISNFSIDAVFGTVTLNGNPSVSFPYLGIPTPPSS
ncbi:MAG TPA: TadE/TadG family type IV pilus assembly protein [Bryobacteraceae bacterium]|jgi:Flp pilus assembly protein TadG|nr:TadE/TadG family type IV pilus assembly protein [Bryobacteraceae bacterium]